MKTNYFPRGEGSPAPLSATVTRRVRFEEVDPLGIVWHGRYPSFFEDAREHLGNSLGIGYTDFFQHGLRIPLRRLSIDYLRPLAYPEEFSVQAKLHWSEAMRLNYEYAIYSSAGELLATGCTVHLVVDAAMQLQMTMPAFYRVFLDTWRDKEP